MISVENIECWECNSIIKQENILGVGTFNKDIGRLYGKGFIAFKCDCCNKIRYQILNKDNPLLKEMDNFQGDIPLEKITGNKLDINQVIDFYGELKNIENVTNFLRKCSQTELTEDSFFNKPFHQNNDIIELFEMLNKNKKQRAMIVTLDKNRYLRNWKMMGRGTGHKINFEPRIVFGPALQLKDKALVYLVDNFMREQEKKPNHQDIVHVKRLIKAAKILGVDFKDRLVVEGDDYYSFKKLNLI